MNAMRWGRSLVVMLALLGLTAGAAAGAAIPQESAQCPNSPPWSLMLPLDYPPSIVPGADGVINTTYVVRERDLCVPMWTPTLCKGTFTVCSEDKNCGATAPAGSCANAKTCANSTTSCDEAKDCNPDGSGPLRPDLGLAGAEAPQLRKSEQPEAQDPPPRTPRIPTSGGAFRGRRCAPGRRP